MVNWEQIINEMDLPPLGEPRQAIYIDSDAEGSKHVNCRCAFTFEVANPISDEMMEKAVELHRKLGSGKFEAMLKMQVDQAMLDFYRKQLPPIDNDML